ncbi:hypothetical protein BDV96DRAFT_509274 [Lophiotrema nucula]|uniref:TROVE domain-containing protein n=1 Tax=Lophiotrema nucula TaxID=690887 RepID=A0A6A5YH34_9PLEO|nr:hypothetical protein BDV96DRAFT_509274 [Lophiotrema nucula]
MASTDAEAPKHSPLDSTFPVLLPRDPALFLPEQDFHDFVTNLLSETQKTDPAPINNGLGDKDDDKGHPELKRQAPSEEEDGRARKSVFVGGLLRHEAHLMTEDDLAAQNKTITQNADVTNVESKSALVDAFYDLGESTPGKTLKQVLEKAWAEDPLTTLRIVFNARSIHLGKGNKVVAYKALGWLAETHPITLLKNLKWLVRPIIEKKAPKLDKKDDTEGKKGASSDTTVGKVPSNDPMHTYDVRFGVSHGYWKDLLNLVALAANDELKFDGDPSAILNQHPDNTGTGKRSREWNAEKAAELRKAKNGERHKRVVKKLNEDAFYRALHLTVARLFAAQLVEDIELLNSDTAGVRKVSLAGKWAPSATGFHDKHTFILSSIAEIIYPNPVEVCPDASHRELYLRHAREAYRMHVGSPLRKALKVVERYIVTETFDEIKYDRVPSLAMDRYTPLFIRKDFDNFREYITKVATGGAKISGATLLPSTLVSKALKVARTGNDIQGAKDLKQVKSRAEAALQKDVLNGQWKTLVERIRGSGVLESSIAICDVSGSMTYPTFKDLTCPMDSSIGLSLLLAEVTQPPFGGAMITFSEQPTAIQAGGPEDSRDFVDKVQHIGTAPWGFSTNFAAVFEHLILPMALSNKLKQEDMVKQVFVFSDMQFDEADTSPQRWTTSFERIKQQYEAAGYEMPKLIFWNLHATSTNKPTTMEDVNTALVSGYSQGMLKVFMEGGGFESNEEEGIVEQDGEDGMVDVKVKMEMDPLTIVKKAVSHKAYSMLEVFD